MDEIENKNNDSINTSNQRIVDKPIQSELKNNQEGTGLMFVMLALIYIILISMFFN